MAEATAAAAQAANPGMDRFNRYYNAVLAQLQQDAGPERSDSQLKNYLMRMIRPTYDQAIAQRQQQTGQANAAIDTDAASRGMGTSTWVTDAKNRQRQNEAQDVATLNSNYNSTLYDSLLGLINQRDQNRLALMNQAQGVAGSMYDRWKAEDDALAAKAAGGGGGGFGGGGSGRGGGGGGGEDPTDPGYGTGTGLDVEQMARNGANLFGTLTGNIAQAIVDSQAAKAAQKSQMAGNMTQTQRERAGYDDKIDGKYVSATTQQPKKITIPTAPSATKPLGFTLTKKKV